MYLQKNNFDDLYDVETSVMSLEQNGQKHLVCFPYDVKQGEKN